MLTHLSIENFTLVDALELELASGMTVITGETGAGKSILLDALNLAIGDRADADKIRSGKDKADICATFDIQEIPSAREWLLKNELGSDSECLLRRVVGRDGRSRGYINGKPAPISQLKELGEYLMDLHSQHAHQSLLKKTTHQRLLDDYAGHPELLESIRLQFRNWQSALKQLNNLRNNADEVNARLQLLRYQVQELDALGLEPEELEQLEQEQVQLSNAENTILSSQKIAQLCEDDEAGLLQLINHAIHLLSDIPEKPSALISVTEHFVNAQIEVQEAQSALRNHIDNFVIDPERLLQVENRLSSIYEVARKHRLNPEDLIEFHKVLAEDLNELESGAGDLDSLELEVQQQHENFVNTALQLSKQRQTAGKELQEKINEQLQLLSMQHAHFEIALNTDTNKTSAHGIDDIEFLIRTNSGQIPKSLAKVASGGELSRISLAIQVVTAQSSTTPTLVFDEVDVGIGGATASIVGQLLQRLGSKAQVICVTHLAQVASKGHQHLLVEKQSDEKSAQSTLRNLNKEERTLEIARMMGGDTLTHQTMALATEMIQQNLNPTVKSRVTS